MNTPAHAILGALALSRRQQAKFLLPIVIGGLLPDLSMIIFYAWAKAAGIPEATIWGELYRLPTLQLLFDAPNSIPITLGLGLLLLLRKQAGWAMLLFAMTLHSLCDLGLHHDDSHRHFWPLSDWRFASPISYWDPRHYGNWYLLLELVLMIAGSYLLWQRHPSAGNRALIALVIFSYAAFFWYASKVWL